MVALLGDLIKYEANESIIHSDRMGSKRVLIRDIPPTSYARQSRGYDAPRLQRTNMDLAVESTEARFEPDEIYQLIMDISASCDSCDSCNECYSGPG